MLKKFVTKFVFFPSETKQKIEKLIPTKCKYMNKVFMVFFSKQLTEK